MRCRTMLLALAAVALATAACGGQDDVEGTDERPVVTGDVGQAVEVAQLSLPGALGDDVVADLIDELCSAAGTGDVDGVVGQLQTSVDPAQVDPSLEALAAGAGTYCPDDVDDVVPQVQQALAPVPTTTAAPATAAAGTGATGGVPSGSSSAGSSSGGSTSGGTSNSSSGSAAVGGGDASGTGNSSSTDFTQGVGSSNSSSSGASGSSSSTTG